MVSAPERMMEIIAVCVCTFRRPAQLARLLRALSEMHCPLRTVFVIVDNDGNDAETQDVVRAFERSSDAAVSFVIESEPGLSAARNRALKEARATGARAVAFLDDDEWPSPQWLNKLIEIWSATGAAAIGGPVLPVFEKGSEPPEKYQALWAVRKGRLGGRTHVYCTCNCFIDLAALASFGDEAFSADFAFTGGEDVVLFRRLHAAGTRMAWSDEAIVFEQVSAERASFGWLRRRWYRLGNIGVKCERAAPVGEVIPPLAKSLLLAARLPFYPLFNGRVLTRPRLWLLEAERIRGRLAYHAGVVVMQYSR
jgi:succinoglycan biosynthesis protein ExoM